MATVTKIDRVLPTENPAISLSEVRLSMKCKSIIGSGDALVYCGDDRAMRRELNGAVTFRCLGRCHCAR